MTPDLPETLKPMLVAVQNALLHAYAMGGQDAVARMAASAGFVAPQNIVRQRAKKGAPLRAIIAVLEHVGRPMRAHEIADALGCDSNSIGAILSRSVATGALEKVKLFYSLPGITAP